jgi:glucose-6-phosphate 1-dehydrogenase
VQKKSSSVFARYRTPFSEGTEALARNRLVISLQPDDTIEMHLLAKASNRAKAEQGRLVPVKLDLDFRQAFGTRRLKPMSGYFVK